MNVTPVTVAADPDETSLQILSDSFLELNTNFVTPCYNQHQPTIHESTPIPLLNLEYDITFPSLPEFSLDSLQHDLESCTDSTVEFSIDSLNVRSGDHFTTEIVTTNTSSITNSVETSIKTIPSEHLEVNLPVDICEMAKSISCQKFSGYPHENGDKFINEFNSYATLINVDSRKIAAFHLHLQGPALTWFNTLDSAHKQSWDNLLGAFKERFLTLDWQSPRMMVESTNFQGLSLISGQPLEDFYCQVLEKGNLIGKPDFEVLSKFISGLPHELAFFVRAGCPRNIDAALSSAKMGETCGYRKHDVPSSPTEKICAAVKPRDDDINDLKTQVQALTDLVKDFAVGQAKGTGTTSYRPRQSQHKTSFQQQPWQNQAPHQSQAHQGQHQAHQGQHQLHQGQHNPHQRRVECFACYGEGHTKRTCYWNGVGESKPSLQCQLCFQYGHRALACLMFVKRGQGNLQDLTGTHPSPPGTAM
ncbi:hypothetical protein CI610_02729 [invertebrate metagenome]|uniref:Retrotransposon gag domain-containing protein n=1 Tax=invertebrate metagenome TaxID=1711999 RepID=A0A2H9T559_9ZZZZ